MEDIQKRVLEIEEMRKVRRPIQYTPKPNVLNVKKNSDNTLGDKIYCIIYCELYASDVYPFLLKNGET